MRRLAVLTLAAIAAVSLAGESVAGSVDYTFSFTSGTGVTPTVQAGGTLELTLNSGSTDQYTVTGALNVTISGTAIGPTSESLTLVPNTNAPNSMNDPTSGIVFDNQIVLANGSKLLNDFGLLFSGPSNLYVNFYTPTQNSADFALLNNNGTNTNTIGGVFALSVPEPSSFILAATAIVPAIATAARRRRRARAAH